MFEQSPQPAPLENSNPPSSSHVRRKKHKEGLTKVLNVISCEMKYITRLKKQKFRRRRIRRRPKARSGTIFSAKSED